VGVDEWRESRSVGSRRRLRGMINAKSLKISKIKGCSSLLIPHYRKHQVLLINKRRERERDGGTTFGLIFK
jgi:hypothetical protein